MEIVHWRNCLDMEPPQNSINIVDRVDRQYRVDGIWGSVWITYNEDSNVIK